MKGTSISKENNDNKYKTGTTHGFFLFVLYKYASLVRIHRGTVQAFNFCSSRPDVCRCPIVHTPGPPCQRNRPNISMIHVAYKSKLLSVVRSSLHPWPGNWVAIRRTAVYYARAARVFAGIKCRHCIGGSSFPNTVAYLSLPCCTSCEF